jgi:hypothetical protein
MIAWWRMDDDEIREWLATPGDESEREDYLAWACQEIRDRWTPHERALRAACRSRPYETPTVDALRSCSGAVGIAMARFLEHASEIPAGKSA